ncbi:MAG: VPS10 domain-containing protein [Candidatus Eiseniibacteriota bacterium]
MRNRPSFPLFLAFLSFALLTPASASHAAATASSADAKKPKELNDLLSGMKYRCIGPYRGGRVTAVTGVRGEPFTFYFGSTGGGVWKSTDAGSNWESVSDKDFKSGSVGAIAVSESDHNVIVAGMGESPIRGNLSAGDGVYRSTDGGASWTNIGLKDAGQISRVRIHPNRPDLIYVAVQGHAWKPNSTRGVYRTEDAGKTWKRVLSVNDSTGACDLSMDPNNPRILYAAMWQAVRRPWDFASGGAGSGLWRSMDGGDTWKKLTEGLPEGTMGRIGVAASGAKSGLVWAIIESAKGGLYRSDDRGDKWTWVNDDHFIRERPWYYTWVIADPRNADKLWLPNLRLYTSKDGGKSFSGLNAIWDHHDLWIDPDNSDHMILGADGGCAVTLNGAKTWSSTRNQPTAQFYRVTTDNRFPYWVYGAQQDNSSVGIPSAAPGGGIGETDWYPIGGGESGWIAVDPRNPLMLYGGGYGGSITRYDVKLKEDREVMNWPQLASGRPVTDLRYRFQWNAPTIISLQDSTTVYHAAQMLLRSRDQGQSWEEVSPDLTRNDKTKQGLTGGAVTRDITGVELYGSIFTLSESPAEPGVIWAGTDDGLVQVTRDACKSWQNVTPKGIPEWIRINSIDASPNEKGCAYLAATMYQYDDNHPYLYKTRDYGKSWTRINTGIPEGAFTRVIREDPARRGLLYAGTESGIYVSFDDGGTWQAFQRNLPVTPVTDLTIKNGDLVVATQGRSFWILDDLTPLRNWSAALAAQPFHLFQPRPTFRTSFAGDPDNPPKNQGQNPPDGVIVDYWLKDKPGEKDTLKLDIYSGDALIRSFSSAKDAKPADLKEKAELDERNADREKPLDPDAGLNRFVWDMRIVKPTLTPKAVFNEGTKAPPKVGAGTYQVVLRYGDHRDSARVEVRPNPEGHATAADLRAQFDLLSAIRDRLSESHVAVMTIRDVRAQARDLGERAQRLGKGDDLAKRAKALGDKLTAVERKLTNPDIKGLEDDLNYPPQLDHDFTFLAGVVGTADRRPTDGALRIYDDLQRELQAIQAELKGILDRDLADFNRAVQAAGIPPVTPSPRINP